MHLLKRSGLIAAPLAFTLIAATSSLAAAQVATLQSPDETRAPDAVAGAATDVEFADREEALLAFAQCMRDNDIQMDDPQPDSGGRGFFRRGPDGAGDSQFDIQGETFQNAQQSCGWILEAARPDLDAEAQAERLEEQLAMAQCFRDAGLEDYPDPVLGSDGRLQRAGGFQLQELGFDPRSEEFQAIRGECAARLGVEVGPGGRGGPGGN